MPLSLGSRLELLTVPKETEAEIAALVARYRSHRDAYQSPEYKEAQLRQEFLNPFFAALGWDMDNERGFAEPYKEVVHEDRLRVGGAMKAPDYCFRYGGVSKFFVEAKSPSTNVKGDPAPAYQLRRYGWSAHLPLSVLTDFEEFAVYDCREKPSPDDTPAHARIAYLTFEEYLDELPRIYSLFSNEAIPKGVFDRWAESAKGKRGTDTVDAAFLKEIEGWRDTLARNIALRNDVSVEDLNFAVQSLIDRLLFLRIAEDRGVERYGQLQEIAEQDDFYRRLCRLFAEADDKYNSGLFDFSESGDQFTPDLAVDDKVIKPIIADLYYPQSPYEFSVIGADILGAVYEQFLGKVIRLTAGGRAKVEEKPEVKKAGGVYYTPKYIVDYIVEHTVGEATQAAGTPKKVAGLHILDPACGSGSFLLGAYQRLLDWHLDYYSEHDPEKLSRGRQPVVVPTEAGDWRLSTAERKRILLDNIYGVDIDAQAVEVTKLNLLLKCLEGETERTIEAQQTMFHERALPNLGSNIKCGNSLIGPDYFTGRLDYDDDERRRVNPFDWQAEFPDIMSAGGFDCVIGNPPYIQSSMAEYADESTNAYFRTHYSSSMGRLNTFGLFTERMLRVCLGEGGLFSFIVPNTLLTQEYYRELRLLMLQSHVRSLTTFTEMVFAGAVVETAVFVLERAEHPEPRTELVQYDNSAWSLHSRSVAQSLFVTTHENAFLTTADEDFIGLANRLSAHHPPLRDTANINQAIALKRDRAASLSDRKRSSNCKPVLDGRDIQRYAIAWPGTYLDYDRDKIHSCKRTDIFEADQKILFRRVGDRLIATLDTEAFYALNTIVVITWKSPQAADLRYLLGLFNSRLMDAYYRKILKSTKKVFSEIQARQVGALPIRPIDSDDPEDVARHDQMVGLVERMMDLHKRLPEAKTPRTRKRLEREIRDTDAAIDALVYELYDLTAEEIAIVEDAASVE
jgi:hypothetical protein